MVFCRNELQASLDKATVQLAGEQQALRSLAAQGSLRDALVQSTAARASADATRLVEQLSSQLDARHAESADMAARLASAEALIQRLKHRVQVGHDLHSLDTPIELISVMCTPPPPPPPPSFQCRAVPTQRMQSQIPAVPFLSRGRRRLSIRIC